MDEIPLFPLPLVLFPGGDLQLQIFEPRYLDMIRDCGRDDSGFGIILIDEGDQVLRHAEQQLPSICHCGTYCRIIDFDQQPNGLLGITVRGEKKFVISDYFEADNRLMKAKVSFLPDEDDLPLASEYLHLVDMLTSLYQHESLQNRFTEVDMTSSVTVGSRLAELIPCPTKIKQRLLELKDPEVRLNEIDKLILAMQEAAGS